MGSVRGAQAPLFISPSLIKGGGYRGRVTNKKSKEGVRLINNISLETFIP